MARSKAPGFDPLSYHQSLWSKALSHPARIRILCYLLENGRTSFALLSKITPLARTTVSQHLRNLREAGLVRLTEEYPHSFYELEPKHCRKLAGNMMPLEKRFSLLSG